MVARLEKAGDALTASAFRWCCSVLSRKFIFNIDSQKEDALDVTNEFVEIGKPKICFNFNNNL